MNTNIEYQINDYCNMVKQSESIKKRGIGLKYLTLFAIAFAVSGILIAVDPVGRLAAYTYAQKSPAY